jgi:hypothetical protein
LTLFLIFLGLATLSLDDDYIRKRQTRHIEEKPTHVGEGLLYGTKELARGVGEGLAGIVYQV